MSSVDVANGAASTSKARVAVTARSTIWSNGEVIEIKIPKDATPGVYEHGTTKVSYLMFARPLKGGGLNFFLHTSDHSLRGKTIRAEVVLMEKELEDGRRFFYIDLMPLDDATPATHRLFFANRGDFGTLPGDWPRFDTPTPIQASIILASPGDAKLPQKQGGNGFFHQLGMHR